MSVLAFVVVVILVGCCSMTVNARKCYNYASGPNITTVPQTEKNCSVNVQYCFTASYDTYKRGGCNDDLQSINFSCTTNNCTKVTVSKINLPSMNVCCCDSDLCNSANSPISKLTATTTLMMLFVIVSAAFINARQGSLYALLKYLSQCIVKTDTLNKIGNVITDRSVWLWYCYLLERLEA